MTDASVLQRYLYHPSRRRVTVVIGGAQKFEAFLGLSDGLSLVGPGRIYPKGLKRIRVEMAELGGKIGVKVRGYINIGVVI